LRAAGGAHRHLRPGWHALGGAPDVHPGAVLPGSRPGHRKEEPGVEGAAAVQDGLVRRARGNRQAATARDRRDPAGHHDRHDDRAAHRGRKAWLQTANHPHWDRPYTDLTYQPMQEVLRYLRANDYK